MSGTVFGNRSRQRPGSPYTDSSLDLASLGSKSILDDDGSVAMDAALPRQPPRRVNIFILFIFILELLCLVFVAVLAYFLRMTDVFPVRHQNFSCWDAAISLTPAAGADSFSSFSFRADVPDTAVITVCFCLPPLLIVLCEAALWAVTDEPQKTVRALCHEFKLPQAVRRVIRFTGTFLFGLLVTLVLTDVTKLFVGRLRPTFLASCRPNATRCGQHGDIVDEDACTETDMAVIRHARLSFPSLHASTTFYTAVFLAIYLHAVIRVPGVRVLRPFLGLGCVTMATMCCLARYGRHHSHWTDVAAGAGGGATIALYISLSVLTSFRERLSAAALYARLRLFLQQQRHLELSHLYKEVTPPGSRRGHRGVGGQHHQLAALRAPATLPPPPPTPLPRLTRLTIGSLLYRYCVLVLRELALDKHTIETKSATFFVTTSVEGSRNVKFFC